MKFRRLGIVVVAAVMATVVGQCAGSVDPAGLADGAGGAAQPAWRAGSSDQCRTR